MAAIKPERGRAAPGVSGYSRLAQIPVFGASDDRAAVAAHV
jgi:hypothetical protein